MLAILIPRISAGRDHFSCDHNRFTSPSMVGVAQEKTPILVWSVAEQKIVEPQEETLRKYENSHSISLLQSLFDICHERDNIVF